MFSMGLEQTHLLYVAYNIEGALFKKKQNSLHSSHNMFNENMSYARAHAWYCYCDCSANSKRQNSFPPWVSFVRSLGLLRVHTKGSKPCLTICACFVAFVVSLSM